MGVPVPSRRRPRGRVVAVSLTIMTFNLRYASDQPPHAWPQRRPVVAEVLTVAGADIIGTQEGLAAQIADVATDHPEYGRIGRGRDADGTGESGTIFYRRDRLTVRDHGHFWLSDTPELPGSTSWGNTLPRMASWVRFHDHDGDTDRELVLLNTHLDHESAAARVRGAELICRWTEQLDAELPVIITGDFNAIARADPTYDVFVDAGFVDLRFGATERIGPDYDSFHGYEAPGTRGDHIDWILARGPVVARRFGLIDVQLAGQRPSDHFPLAVRVDLAGGSGA